MKKIYSLLAAILLWQAAAMAQSGLGEIRGKVIDGKDKKPLDYVTLTAFLNGVAKATTHSDDEGEYVFKTLPAGEYSIKAFIGGYPIHMETDIEVISDKITFTNIVMEKDIKLQEVTVKSKPPLIRKDGISGSQLGSKQIMAMPQRNINMVANLTSGVDARSGGTPNIRGARSDGTAYYIDGVRVQGGSSVNIPQNAIDQIQVIVGGTPAQYGDFVGGAISITTKAPTRNFIRTFEYTTASPFNGTLDNSLWNEFQGVISGPLKIINKGRGDQERVLIGFLLSGSVNYQRDGRLPAVDLYKVNDAKLAQLQATPLTHSSNGGVAYSAEYLKLSDLEKVGYRQNVPEYRVNLQGNFNFQPSENINLRLGYQANMYTGRGFSFYNSLMNSQNNSLTNDYTFRSYLQFTQTFNKKKDSEKDKNEKPSVISNAFYTVRFSYETRFVETMDADMKYDFFNYGYLGRFKSYQMPFYTTVAKNYGEKADSFLVNGHYYYLTNYKKQVGYIDTAYRFVEPVTSGRNAVLANYTKSLFDLLGNQSITNYGAVRSQLGLINGDAPNGIYSNMWGNVGSYQASYSKSRVETYNLYVMSEASIAPKNNPKAKHDLQFGVTYEQYIQRSYSLGAIGLWSNMRLLANQKFQGLDSSLYILKFDQNGVFQDTVNYLRRIDPNSVSSFGEKLRSKLASMGETDVNGRPVDSRSYIDVNSYKPGTYSLDMFSANELLRDGQSSLVGYNGYDYLGNRVNGKPGINEWINNRLLPAYQPVYAAAWIQDKFVFKDLILRLGVRFERFDANQPVLRDPYALVPVYTAGDVRRADLHGLKSEIPTVIGDDYVVYVDKSPDSQSKNSGNYTITGYRQGNNWYDKNGNFVTDPSTLNRGYTETNGRNTPLLVNPSKPTEPTVQSFKDYVPDVKISPRVWFSFPISTTSQFFGTYDILTQRPTQGTNIAQMDDYFYLINRQNSTIANPDLKFTQVTDYEIGFRQQIGDNSSLGIVGSYREFRNMIQLYRYNQSWPTDYTTFGNLDFATVKSFRLEYELRDMGNVNISANYQLQFVEGTGSSATTSGNVIATGLAGIRTIYPLDFDVRHTLKGVFDYHYQEGKKYDGPIVNGKKILENAGFNIIFNAVSGRPYTQHTTATPEGLSGVVSRSTIKGTINGSNLPAQFYTDISFDKYFNVERKRIDGRPIVYRWRTFLMIQNVFNTANVLSVYRYTGSAYSDGFITSPQAKQNIDAANSAQSFVDLYNLRVIDPGSFSLPRIVRLGVSLSF